MKRLMPAYLYSIDIFLIGTCFLMAVVYAIIAVMNGTLTPASISGFYVAIALYFLQYTVNGVLSVRMLLVQGVRPSAFMNLIAPISCAILAPVFYIERSSRGEFQLFAVAAIAMMPFALYVARVMTRPSGEPMVSDASVQR